MKVQNIEDTTEEIAKLRKYLKEENNVLFEGVDYFLEEMTASFLQSP